MTSMSSREILPKGITTLGAAIRHLREHREMTLRGLAKAVNCSAPFLSDVEHNRRSPKKLEPFAKALGVDVEVLQPFTTRLEPEMREWIAANPDVVRLLEDLRASGRKP